MDHFEANLLGDAVRLAESVSGVEAVAVVPSGKGYAVLCSGPVDSETVWKLKSWRQWVSVCRECAPERASEGARSAS